MDLIGLIPSFGGLLWTTVAFVIALSIIVAVHEFGHYIVARWSGIHSEVFSLGFGPVLWSRVDKRGTRWQIAALPFGGYVKFLGDANAASGKDDAAIAQLSPQEQRHTMHGAPLWARAATVAAGPMFNFILSAIIFALFFLVRGVETEVPTVASMRDLPTQGQPLLPGDKILAINGTPTPDWKTMGEVVVALPDAPTSTYTLDRDGREITLEGPFPFPPLIGFVTPQSAGMDAGVQAGDVILSVDGVKTLSFRHLRDIVGASDGKSLTLQVWRAGETIPVTLTPRRMDVPKAEGGFETRWAIGLTGDQVFVAQVRTPGLFETAKIGVVKVWDVAAGSLSGLWHMITGAISSCNLRGPIGIAETSGAAATAGLDTFIFFIATLSTAVGLMNLFPIPVLDGGHLVFHAFEAVTGKPPSEGALRVLMTIGLMLVLTMMVFGLSNDLFCP